MVRLRFNKARSDQLFSTTTYAPVEDTLILQCENIDKQTRCFVCESRRCRRNPSHLLLIKALFSFFPGHRFLIPPVSCPNTGCERVLVCKVPRDVEEKVKHTLNTTNEKRTRIWRWYYDCVFRIFYS